MEVAYTVHIIIYVFFFDAPCENDLFILFRLVTTLACKSIFFQKIIGARTRGNFIECNICVCIPTFEMYNIENILTSET